MYPLLLIICLQHYAHRHAYKHDIKELYLSLMPLCLLLNILKSNIAV